MLLKKKKGIGRMKIEKGWGWGRSANFNNTSRGGSTEKLTLEQSLAGEEVSHGAEAMVSGRDNSLRRLAMCLRSPHGGCRLVGSRHTNSHTKAVRITNMASAKER